jgi:hypothetical protein
MTRRGLILFLFLSAGAWAAPDGRVRLSIDSDKAYWVGQRVLVHLDLMTSGFSFSGQRFNLPQISGGVLLQTDSSTLKLNEQIDGESWQILRYDLSFFTQRAGDVQIPPFDVRFNASLGYGQPEASFELKTEALTVVLELPPGADPSQPVVTTSRLTVQESWQPDQLDFRVGEALTRTITIQAEDVSGIALPAMPTQKIAGIDLLPKAPLVEDKSNRGTLAGHRREQVSYLFQREGSYTLPETIISWWNPETKTLEQYELPAKLIDVAPDPLAKVNNDEPENSFKKNRLALLLGAILLAVTGLIVFWQWPRIQALRAARFASERAQFKRAIRACRKNDARAAWSMTNAWLALVGLSIPTEDEAVWQELQRAMVSNSENWSGRSLKNSLISLRKKAWTQAGNSPYLKPLNP